jgi:chromosome partitioning protein
VTTLAIFSNKGGVGKTATAVNLAYLAAESGMKTLLCDLDPQSSATYYFRIKPKLKAGAAGWRKGGKAAYRSIKGTDYEGLDLLPADFSLRHIDIVLHESKGAKKRLRRSLRRFASGYDLVVLDCPVTSSILAENIVHAADMVLVPLIPTTLSVRAHEQLLAHCHRKNHDTGKFRIFFSMVDLKKNMHKEFMTRVSEESAGVMKSYVPYTAQVEKMGIYREPVPVSSPGSTAAASYRSLWEEVRTALFNDGSTQSHEDHLPDPARQIEPELSGPG